MSKKKSFSEVLKEVGDAYSAPLVELKPGDLVVKKDFLDDRYGTSDNSLMIVVDDHTASDDPNCFGRPGTPRLAVGTLNPNTGSFYINREEHARLRKPTVDEITNYDAAVVEELKKKSRPSPAERLRTLLGADE